MNPTRTTHLLRAGLALVLVLALGGIAGCGGTSSTPTSSGPTVSPAETATAKKAFALATSKLGTTAPDGKLLIVQTAAPVTPTSTPIWEFLIGSPKTDVIYAVMVENGQAQVQPYSKAGLKASEWARVPANDTWKIDSNVAHAKAVAVHPAGKTAAYFMGFVTYIPKGRENPNSKIMQWVVSFDPTKQGSAPTSTVNVDVATGVAAYSK